MGCGTVACYGHLPAIVATPGLRLAAVFDPDGSRLDVVGKHWGDVARFATAEPFFSSGLDAVVVTSPAPSHLANVSDAARYGLPVLCEKPLAIAQSDAQAIVDLMARAGLPLFTAFCYRFSPCALAIKEFVTEGAIGCVRSLRLIYDWDLHGKYQHTTSGTRTESARRRDRMREGGPLVDCGVHQIDLARWWLGSEVKQKLAVGAWVDEYEAPDHVYLHLDHECGAHSLVEVSVSYTHTAKEPRSHFVYELIGTDGLIRYCREERVFEIRTPQGTRRLLWHEEKDFEGMYAAFERALTTQESGHLASGMDGLVAGRIAREATDSIVAKRGSSGTV
jgi:predicted dehydrogenase